MIAYSIRIDGTQVGIILTSEQLGGNDLTHIKLAFCSEHNASISRASHAYLGNSFVALEIKPKDETTA